MKHARLFSLLTVLLLAFACTNDPEDLLPSPDPGPETADHRVPVEAALSDLESMLAQIDEPATRGGATRRVGAIATVKAADLLPATRSGEKPALEDLVYLANFEGGEGYALLGADDRMPSIIAITDRGSLTPDELAAAVGTVPTFSSDNPPAVIPEVAAYLQASAFGGIIGGIDGPPIIPPLYDKYTTYGPWAEGTRISSMIKVKWGQGAPHNKYCPEYAHDQHAPVGCVAVALGQIAAMNIYEGKYPSYHLEGNYPFQWGQVLTAIETLQERYWREFKPKEDTQETNAVASLLRTIGNLVGMKYGPDESTAYTVDAAAFMTHWLGYKNVSLIPYSKEAVYGMLKKKLPLYIAGYELVNGTCRDGHAWVIDGWSRQQRTVYTYSMKTNALLSTKLEYRELFHCNYGWNGQCDGYYFSGMFDIFTGHGPEYTDQLVGDKGMTKDKPYNLNGNLSIITYSPFL